jgi:hypothetical protein
MDRLAQALGAAAQNIHDPRFRKMLALMRNGSRSPIQNAAAVVAAKWRAWAQDAGQS